MSDSYRYSTPEAVGQADGPQTLPISGDYRFNTLTVHGGTSGTLAVGYLIFENEFELLDDADAPIVIDLASNDRAFNFEGNIDGITLTPTGVVGSYTAQVRCTK